MSDSAFPSTARSARRAVCIHPSCTSLPASYPRSKSRGAVRVYTSVQAAVAALPQGPSLRSELFCLGPSSLNRPHPSHSSAHPDFAARRLIRDAFAVPIGPRRPTSGSGLSLSVPSLHVVLKDPGEPIGCSCPAPSPTASAFTLEGRVRRLPTLPSNPFHEGRNDFGASCFTFATTCKVARLPDGSSPQWADGDFYARAFDGSVALPAAGYDYSGGWAPPPTGLAPAGTSTSLAATPYHPYSGFSPVRLEGRFISRCLTRRLRVLRDVRFAIRPSCTSLPVTSYPRSESRDAVRWCTTVQAAIAALPQGSSLRSGLCCPGPSSLIDPMRPTRQHIPISPTRLIRDVFAVRHGATPRQPASGSVLS
jgi:hypothetical protein